MFPITYLNTGDCNVVSFQTDIRVIYMGLVSWAFDSLKLESWKLPWFVVVCSFFIVSAMLVIYLCFFNVVYTFMSYISMPWLNQSGLLSLVVAPIVWRRCGQHRFMHRSSVVAACICLRRRQVVRRQGLGFFAWPCPVAIHVTAC